MRRTYGDDHVKTLTTQRLIGNNLTDLGNYEEAERVLLECADAQRRLLGPDHPRLQETLYDLALVYRYSGRYPEARRFYRDSLRIVLKVRGENHPLVFACLNGVGETFLREQRYDEAEASLSEAMTSGRKALSEHSVVGVAASRLARVRKARGRLEEAEELLTEALGIFRSTMGDTNDWTINTLVELAAMKALRGEREKALSLLGEAVDLGFSPAKLAEDPDFAPIQDDPGFVALVGQVN
jgi:tetratricopeptide (TPR) repeat protein